MDCSASPSASEDRERVAAQVLYDRARGIPWKQLEHRFGRDRSTLWRWAAEFEDARCNKTGSSCNIFALDAATSFLEPGPMEDLACSTCPHWRRLKAPGKEATGRCMLRDGSAREETEYCGDHPVLKRQELTAMAVAIGTAMAGVMAGTVKELRGEPGSPSGGFAARASDGADRAGKGRGGR